MMLLLSVLGLAGCSLSSGEVVESGTSMNTTETPVPIRTAVTTQSPMPTVESNEVATVTTPSGLVTQSAPVELRMPVSDQVIFTINNPEPWSGVEGDPRPDWKGWGAGAFVAAPDGTFWIADTAVHPNRLLHYQKDGELLSQFSMGDQVVYIADISLIQNSLWILDTSATQPHIVQTDFSGNVLRSVDITWDIVDLIAGEHGELFGYSFDGYIELIDETGEVNNQKLETLSFYGHEYQIGEFSSSVGTHSIRVNGNELNLPGDFFLDAPSFIGFYPEGSFALAGHEKINDLYMDHQVWYFDRDGELLGKARQYPMTMYKDWNHHLAYGPEGNVFQLLSNMDHSVQIIRLGFVSDLPKATLTPTPVPTPLSTLAIIDPAVTDEEKAQNTLIQFFQYLSEGKPAKAAPLFGGSIQEMSNFYGDSSGMTDADYWEDVCQFLWCLPVAEITGIEKVSDDEYSFQTVFVDPYGTRFGIGACCGADPAAFPTVYEFAYPVRRIGDTWLVMRLPLYTP